MYFSVHPHVAQRDDVLVQEAVRKIAPLCPELDIPWLPAPEDTAPSVELQAAKYTRAEFTKIAY